MILVTGGAGFIGSNFILRWLEKQSEPVINLDKLTYAGNLNNLATLTDDQRYHFFKGDIGDRSFVAQLLRNYRPSSIVNFAAETHVDRSIRSPEDFVRTNVAGTLHLLEESHAYWRSLPEPERGSFRFLHISTDEVYGSLDAEARPATEDFAYAPNSPYAASKAASDHFVRAYHRTYGLPVLITNCSNNYGPFQFPEKLIPLMILNAISGKPLPLYGDGRNVRDWIFVGDHCAAIQTVLKNGLPGETYNVGGNCEKTNIDVVTTICRILDEFHPHPPVLPHSRLITYIKDRPGHDRRYAIDTTKINHHLGWQPKELFETGLRKTVKWYLENTRWVDQVVGASYKEWVSLHYEKGAAE